MSNSPFVIIGCARSGTTLLRTMLNHHPDVAVPPESFFPIDYLRADPNPPASTLRRLMAKEHELKLWELPVNTGDLLDCDTGRALVTRIHNLYRIKHSKKVWGHKTTCFVQHCQIVKSAYPQSKFVHLIRDPRAVVNSLTRSNVHCSNAYYGSRRWMTAFRAGLDLKRRYPPDVLEIRYEKLVCQPVETLRLVCEFLELPYSAKMLDYHVRGSAEYGRFFRRIHTQLNSAPDQNRIDRWREQLSPRAVAVIEASCGPAMRYLGYHLTEGGRQVGPAYLALLKCEHSLGIVKRVIHSLTTRPGYTWCCVRRRLELPLPAERSLLADTVSYIVQ